MTDDLQIKAEDIVDDDTAFIAGERLAWRNEGNRKAYIPDDKFDAVISALWVYHESFLLGLLSASGALTPCHGDWQYREDPPGITIITTGNVVRFLREKIGGTIALFDSSLYLGGYDLMDLLDRLRGSSKFRMLAGVKSLPAWQTFIGAPRFKNYFHVQRHHEKAALPSKTRPSDAGYDLTLIELISQNGSYYKYDTFISVKPPFGWYFDLVPRSSLTKKGFILANSVGVIDATYRGHIQVVLAKINATEDLELPGKYVQLIPRPMVHFQVHESMDLGETARGAGGFGSTSS